MTCPHCGADRGNLVGIEVPDVYDGVLYWVGPCGHAWARVFVDGALFVKSRAAADAHNAAGRTS